MMFTLTVLGIAKQDCDIQTSEKLLSFLALMNSSATIGFNFLLASISAITSSKTIDTVLC